MRRTGKPRNIINRQRWPRKVQQRAGHPPSWYKSLNRDGQFSRHETVNHGREEYVRGDVTTNTVEGYYSVFKRGMKGVYQHCSEKHLHRYLSEFDFRYKQPRQVGRR